MTSVSTPLEFWDAVAEHVTVKVRQVLGQGLKERAPVIAYLRDLETVARLECSDRAAIQVIASGRGVLGDRGEVGPADGPFSRT